MMEGVTLWADDSWTAQPGTGARVDAEAHDLAIALERARLSRDLLGANGISRYAPPMNAVFSRHPTRRVELACVAAGTLMRCLLSRNNRLSPAFVD
jgi:hypothetical protein